MTRFRRHGHKRRLAAKLFGHHFFGNQFVFHTVRVRVGFVDLVDSNNNGYTCCFGVFDRLFGLRHHTVVSSDHQNHNVSGLCTTRSHGGEGLVAWGIKEGHHATRCFHMVSTDVLGNATGFTRGHFGAANVVKQRGLAVVNVTHDSDHRRTGEGLTDVTRSFFFGKGLRVVQRSDDCHMAHFFHHDHGGVLVQGLVDGDHLSQLHQLLDNF